MIHVTLTYEGRTVPETCAIAELHLVKHLVRFSLNARLTAITLSADNVLIHLGELEVSNLRTHARKLMSNGAVAPCLGSMTSAEYDRMASQPNYCANLALEHFNRTEAASA